MKSLFQDEASQNQNLTVHITVEVRATKNQLEIPIQGVLQQQQFARGSLHRSARKTVPREVLYFHFFPLHF